MAATNIPRFWAKVDKTETCWLWTGAKVPNGYGAISIGHAKPYQAHRFSWEMHFGPIPNEMQVCHKCDVRLYVRPDHLFLGTRKDNMQDMAQKGRQNCKLNPEKIQDIRQRFANGVSAKSLASEFHVDKSMIYLIVKRRWWSHVT